MRVCPGLANSRRMWAQARLAEVAKNALHLGGRQGSEPIPPAAGNGVCARAGQGRLDMRRVRSLSVRPGKRRAPRARFDVESLERRALLSALPPGFQETVWARGLDTPTAEAFAPD